MYFGGFLLRKSGSWTTWMAFRSAVTGAVSIVAGCVVQTTALPALTRQVAELSPEEQAPAEWALAASDWLPFFGVPALLLGLAAIAMRPLRPVLAVLATLASLAAIAAIAATLIGSMLPLYQQMPKDIDLSGRM